MRPFAQSSYLAQVRRLRALARAALEQFPLKVRSLRFIHHGENTTFCATMKDGRKCLVRVHRNDYHSTDAILEELSWLRAIHRRKLAPVPVPVRALNGRFLVEAEAKGVPGSRPVSVFHWVDGKFIHRRSSHTHIFELGKLIARFHKTAPLTRHRHYWTSEGLIGANPKFGAIDRLALVTRPQQRLITSTRKKLLRRLKEFERRFPRRHGHIHADLHFGNVLITKNGLGAIDFDDSGFGFFAYDLAVVLLAVERQFGEKNSDRMKMARQELIAGYRTGQSWDHHDDKIVDDLILARKLMMLGWLDSRADNPRLAKHLRGAIKRVVADIRSMN